MELQQTQQTRKSVKEWYLSYATDRDDPGLRGGGELVILLTICSIICVRWDIVPWNRHGTFHFRNLPAIPLELTPEEFWELLLQAASVIL